MKHDPDLDSLIGYQLQVAYLLMTADARRVLEPQGLTPAKLTALMLIRANPGCDQSALARALSINRSSAMKLINGLTGRGLIERRAGRNLRTNALHLMPEGEQCMKEMLTELRGSDKHMTERLDSSEKATLTALLRKLGPARARRATPEPARQGLP